VIAKINGTLDHKIPGEVIVNVGGVGYQIYIPLSVFYRLPDVGQSVSLFIYTHLREDALQLFGFLEPAEKQVFLLLTSVAGIGPKLGIGILSGIPADELARALKEGDEPRLVSIPGVGKKLAERMIVELRDKLMNISLEGDGKEDGSQLLRDAVSALLNLGYRRPEGERVVRDIIRGGATGLENVLKEALRRLSQ